MFQLHKPNLPKYTTSIKLKWQGRGALYTQIYSIYIYKYMIHSNQVSQKKNLCCGGLYFFITQKMLFKNNDYMLRRGLITWKNV